MKAKLLSIVAAGMFLGMAGVASAAEPVKLSEAQMDGVTAGGIAYAEAYADAYGKFAAASATQVLTTVQVVYTLPTQAGQLTWDLTTAAAASSSAGL